MQFSLFSKRTVCVPTWRGWVFFFLMFITLGWLMILGLHPFLAQNIPPHNGLLVIEGWLPDYALDDALSIYHNGHYEKIICTGIPIETGDALLEWNSYAQMTTARLIKAGINPENILTAIGENVQHDRTYASALAMKKLLKTAGITQTNIHLISMGAHGRRSRLLFSKALGTDYRVGVTSLKDETYDETHWWTSSNGVRDVIPELVAWIYAKFFFNP